MSEVFPWKDAPTGDYAVIGDPIAHSKSPAMHRAAYRAFGLDLMYRAIHVPTGEVPEALDCLRDLGYQGVNVTVPHKEAALAWAERPNCLARKVGAANTLELSTGRAHNTDVYGFLGTLPAPPEDSAPPPLRTLILGAGGSAAAVLTALTENAVTRNVVHVAIWNRNRDRAERLVSDALARLAASDDVPPREHKLLCEVELPSHPDLAGFDLVVNATPASLKGVDLGLDWSVSEPNALAYDLAYGVDEAPFLAGARKAGRRTQDGREMLARQGALAFGWWPVGQDLYRSQHRDEPDGAILPRLERETLAAMLGALT